MRLLVLDGSRMLPSLVRRLAPGEIEIEAAESFDQALRLLREDPPQALIANLGPADLPWRELKTLCQTHEPPIPALFESCVYRSSEEAGLGRLEPGATFLSKPYALDDLRREIERLVEHASRRPSAASQTSA